jgi:hypothetical protein
MDRTGKEQDKIFRVPPLPESAPSSRHLGAGASGWSDHTGTRVMTTSELRLCAWSELPDSHRNEVCRQIRLRCEAFISSLRVDRSKRRSEIDGLVSEVVAHLLRATSLRAQETTMDFNGPAVQPNARRQPRSGRSPSPVPWLEKGQINLYEPARDARVIWIVGDTCNRQALLHRYEDIRRRDRGGKWDGSGYPLVAVDDRTIEQLGGHYDPGEEEIDKLKEQDAQRAWDGLILLTTHQFGVDDDIVALVQVLASDRDTQESFGSQWPIRMIVRALNAGRPNALWTDDRVENAKRRLSRFISRIKEANGLDATDLRALLARYAREYQTVRQGPTGLISRARVHFND